jgi:RHS repeat-associated protein
MTNTDNCGSPTNAPWSGSATIKWNYVFTDNNGDSTNQPGGSVFSKLQPGHYAVTATVIGTASDPAWSDTVTRNISFDVTCKPGGSCPCSATVASSFGTPNITLGSLDVELDFGLQPFGAALMTANGPGKVGQLYIYEPSPTPLLGTANSLKFRGLPDADIIMISGSLRQVATTNGLAYIRYVNSHKYTISFYTNAGVKVSGLYQPVGNPQTIYTNETLDSGGNQFQVTETDVATSTSKVYKFDWDATAGQWKLTTGTDAEARIETLQVTIPDGSYSKTEDRRVKDAGDHLVSRHTTHYQVFKDQASNDWERVVSEVNGDGADAQTTTYEYYANGKLKYEYLPDGGWTYRTYNAYGRIAMLYSSYLNLSAGPTTTESLCRVVQYDYTPFGGSDDGSFASDAARTITERLRGQTVKKTLRVVLNGELREYQCPNAGNDITSTDNLVTVTRTNISGPFAGELSSIERPDGTMSLYSYAFDAGGTFRTNIVDVGVPNEQKASILQGTRTVTVFGFSGETISSTVIDIATGLPIEQVIYSNFDGRHRWQRADYLNGTFATRTYACCGLESETDRQGITTTYEYDSLKRPYHITRDGITTIQTYDAEGRVIQTEQHGTSGPTITLSTAHYDTAGRQTDSYEPRTGTTTYAEVMNNPGRMVTTTYTNGATRIETYAADGALLQVSGTAVHAMRYDYGVEADGGIQRAYTKEIKQNAGNNLPEWTKTYTDLLGRQYKTLFSDNAASLSFYNNQGQLWKQQDPDGVLTLFQYNALGEQAWRAVHVDSGDTNNIDFGGNDRITWTTNDVVSTPSNTVRRSRTYTWPTNTSNVPLLVSTSERAVTNQVSWNTSFGLTSSNVVTVLGGGLVVSSNFSPYGTVAVAYTLNGRSISSTNFDANGGVLGWTTNGYDTLGRLATVTDGRNGTTAYTYNNAGQITNSVTPAPAPGQSGLVTTNGYDSMGRLYITTQPDGTSVTNEYYLTGELEKTYGSRTYPVAYTYDYAGRMLTMTTWTNYASNQGAATTTWKYDGQRGWLTNKSYANGVGPDYTYTPAGRLQTRLWARTVGAGRLTTTYDYNSAGDLSTVSYSDGTPPVVNTYNRLGKLNTVTRDGMTTTLTYNDAGLPLSESYSGGILDGLSITNGYDGYLRRTNLSLLNSSSSVLAATSYGYDAASRLQTVSDGTDSATYGYLNLSPLVETVTFKDGATTRLTTTKQYDHVNRLTSIASINSQPSTIASFSYAYNAASQRTAVTNVDNTTWQYAYDHLGQLTNGWKYTGSTPISDREFSYAFDDIGNRNQTVTGSTTINYTANLLNQYTAVGAQTPVYDADGNLWYDGTWYYVWDGENRLIAVLKSDSSQALVFFYDSQGRRIRKQEVISTSSGLVVQADHRFVYDGWNLIATLDSSASVLQSFIWGNDLSGSLQGAGGVGGLLAVKDTANGSHFYCYDGNGNVTATVSAASGDVSGRWEYGPFGETLNASGTLATANPFLFSTKFQDAENGFYYYGYRYYDPATGRWPRKDPLGEPGFELLRGKKPSLLAGGPNKSLFVQNNPICIIDPLGLWQWGWPPWGNKKKDEKCCKQEDPSPYKDLADKFLTDLAAKVQEAEAEIGRAKVADILDKLGKAKFAVDSIKSICAAKNPDGCEDFLKTGELVDCMLCCTSIHALFSNELAGLGFSVTCKLACKNAN